MTTTPAFSTRKIIAEPMGNGWWITMDEDGRTCEFPSAWNLYAELQQTDRFFARQGISTATVIEWRNVPEGFEVPA